MGTDVMSQLVRGIAVSMMDADLSPGIMHVGIDEVGREYVDVLDRATLEPLARVYSEADYSTVIEASQALMRLAATG